MIELCHLQKAYPNSTPQKDVCVTINKGDVIAVIGPSGCGKSTLLRCINMLDPPTRGNILVDGEDITAHGYDLNRLRRKIGMIFQSFNLFSHQSVVENVMRPQMKLLGRSKQESYDKAYELLSVMGLSRQHTRQPMLQQDLEEFVRQIQTNGVMDDLKSYWFSGFDPDNCVVDRSGITGEKGTVSFAVENAYEPFSFYGNGELQGFDIDFIYRFCREYGYTPEFFSVEYDAIPVGISTGKFDVGMNVIMTEERSENVLIAGPYMNIDIFAVVKSSDVAGNQGKDSLAEKFQQTFIKEDRWKLFLQGAGTTLLITTLSALFGIALGFLLYMLCRKSRLFGKVNDFISWFISGMPTVLLLMVLYYLVFVEWADIGGVWVAIVGFTILFGYAIFEILTTSVSAVGKGQEEGARALGYSSNQAFFHVVLPQALRIAFPQLKSELVSLIKETSIVGYISIADLTRMSDIVRGRTYEAFFPLVTTTIIYFVLIVLILFVFERIEIEMTFRPVRVAKIQKGIRIK